MDNSKTGKPLYKNECKRFALDEWSELTSGSPVEIKICGSWVKTHIEHDGTDYYAVGLRGLKLDGLEARIPERG